MLECILYEGVLCYLPVSLLDSLSAHSLERSLHSYGRDRQLVSESGKEEKTMDQ